MILEPIFFYTTTETSWIDPIKQSHVSSFLSRLHSLNLCFKYVIFCTIWPLTLFFVFSCCTWYLHPLKIVMNTYLRHDNCQNDFLHICTLIRCSWQCWLSTSSCPQWPWQRVSPNLVLLWYIHLLLHLWPLARKDVCWKLAVLPKNQ